MNSKLLNRIFNKDARNIGKVLGSNVKVTSTITSPPYFDMKDYGSKNQVGFGQSYDDYLNDLREIFDNIYEITEDDGSLWVIIDTFKRDNQVVTLPFDLSNKLKESGWLLQDIIIWKKDKTVPWSNNGFMQRKFEYILFFSKSKKFKYNKDKVRNFDTTQLKRWWVKYPERYNPKGKALDEIWEFPIPVQGSWGNQYIRHFCPLPKEMVATMIDISTDKGDIVLDPFTGSGTVPFQSSVMERNYIGFELNPDYIKMFEGYMGKAFKEIKNQYKQLESRNAQSDFKNNILNLRVLKFGRVLINLLEKELDIELKIFVEVKNISSESHKFLNVDYEIIGEIQNEEEMNRTIHMLINKPPLSKFGIDSSFKLLKDKNFNTQKLFTYTKTNSYSFSDFDISSPKVKVISDICVDLNENDYS